MLFRCGCFCRFQNLKASLISAVFLRVCVNNVGVLGLDKKRPWAFNFNSGRYFCDPHFPNFLIQEASDDKGNRMKSYPSDPSYSVHFSASRRDDLQARKRAVESGGRVRPLREKLKTLTVSEVLKRTVLPAKADFEALTGLDLLREVDALDLDPSDFSDASLSPAQKSIAYHQFHNFLKNTFAELEIPKIKRGCSELERVGLIVPVQTQHIRHPEPEHSANLVTVGYRLTALGKLALEEASATKES